MATCSLSDIKLFSNKQFFILLLLTISSIARSQSIRLDGVPCYFVKPEHGIPYRSQNFFYNANEILDFHFPDECDNKKFYLNGIPLSEKDFSLLKIHEKEVDLEKCYYTFDFCGDSVICINYNTTILIPLCINGKEYKNNDSIPLKDFEEKNIKIKKEKRLFKKNRITVQIE